MKKLIFFAFILISTHSYSQIEYGIFGGINNSALSNGTKSFNMHHEIGLHLGIVAEKELGNKLAFRPKLEYSQQGNREFNISAVNYKLNYINLPLDFKFFNSPYILFGPQIGVLINKEFTNYEGEPDSFDYGFNLGFGIDIREFFIELGAYQGLNKLFTNWGE